MNEDVMLNTTAGAMNATSHEIFSSAHQVCEKLSVICIATELF